MNTLDFFPTSRIGKPGCYDKFKKQNFFAEPFIIKNISN